MRVLVQQQYTWMPFGSALSSNPFQGMGNVFFPFNMNLVPAFVIPALFLDGHVHPVLSFSIFAVELFVATYIFGLLANLRLTLVMVASWLMVILSLPFIWYPLLIPVYSLIPHCVDLILAQAILLWAFARIGTGSVTRNAVSFLLVIMIPAYVAVANPLTVVIIVPAVVLGFLLFLARSENRITFMLRFVALAGCAMVLYTGGFSEFLLGNTLYTVPAFFSDELYRHQASVYYSSVLFQSAVFSSAGAVLVLFSIPGAIMVAAWQQGAARTLAALHLILTFVFVVGGVAMIKYLEGWRGPQMSYFEMSLWPTYCLFTIVSIWLTGSVLSRLIVDSMNKFTGRYVSPREYRTRTSIRLVQHLVLISVPVVVLLRAAGVEWSGKGNSPYPPADTSIVSKLKLEIGLMPGSAFRGSVATFTGINPSTGISWFDQSVYDDTLSRNYNNDHRLVGLWYYGIPTLAEYNHYITPPMYLVLSRLLARPIDRQIRNIVALTVVNVDLLRNFGVRYVITDNELGPGFVALETFRPKDAQTLYLYELPSPNLGTYSPVEVIRVDDAVQALTALKKAVNFQAQVITTDTLPDNLIPATTVSLVLDRGEVRLKAESSGTSLLILPLQFSHCLQLSANTGLPIDARLVRVNLVQAGVVFSHSINLVLRFRTGPLGHARCRMRDVDDARSLKIPEAARRFPLLI
jgi:hypothetical protein